MNVGEAILLGLLIVGMGAFLWFFFLIITHKSPTQRRLDNLRKQLDDMKTRGEEREIYDQAQRLSNVGSRTFSTLKEYEDRCAEIRVLQNKCDKDGHYWNMINGAIGTVEGYAGIARMRGVPYHLPHVVAEARETLELAEDFKPKQLEAAIKANRDKYNADRMKRERAPEAVRAEAAKRLAAAENAYSVLTKEAEEKFSWST